MEKSFHKLFKGRAGLSDWYGVRSRFRNTPWIVETGGEDFCRTVRTFKTDTIPRIDTGIHSDTLAMADAVQVAMDFAAKHPDETLILVTGDHETGGLTIGFAGTDYDTYLDTLANQTISYAQFDAQYMNKYKENGTSFEDAMKDVESLFGLKISGEEGDRSVLTEYETKRLRTAYDLSMSDYDVNEFTQEQYVLYGTYNPFSVTVTHILNNKAGVDFTSYSHTGLPVAVFADGNGAENFGGYYDNTDIYNKLAVLLEVK